MPLNYDFIGVYDDVVPKDYCEHLIQMFNKAEAMGFTKSRWEDFGFDGGTKEDQALFAVQIPVGHLLNGDEFKPFQEAFWGAYKDYQKKYHVAMNVTDPHEMASVLTTESVDHLNINQGDEIELVIKAIHVLPVKE